MSRIIGHPNRAPATTPITDRVPDNANRVPDPCPIISGYGHPVVSALTCTNTLGCPKVPEIPHVLHIKTRAGGERPLLATQKSGTR